MTIPELDRDFLTLGAAIAIGILVGIERGWNLRTVTDGTRVAGVRTFTLVGLLGGVAGVLGMQGQGLVAGTMIAATAIILTVGYAVDAAVYAKPDATTAIAGLLTMALGVLAGAGRPILAVALASLVTLTLALRTETHRFIAKLDEDDVKALARFAVLAVAVLPFLPSGSYGPYDAWNPRKLWMVVVAVTGFSFAGYIANRIYGSRRGTIVTALIGGAYSSTAVTQSLAARLGLRGGGGDECTGIAVASTVMYVRVLVMVAALATTVLVPLAVLMAPALVTAAVAAIWLYRRSSPEDAPVSPGNPIALKPALAFLVLVALAAVAARWAEERFGGQGIATLILIMGSLDVDAAIVTVCGLRPGTLTPALAAVAIGGAVLANMAVKFGITLVYARAHGKAALLALGASMLALLLTLGMHLAAM